MYISTNAEKFAYLLAKIGADTAENEQHFAENLPKTGNYPTGPLAPGAAPRRRRRRRRLKPRAAGRAGSPTAGGALSGAGLALGGLVRRTSDLNGGE